MSEPSSINQLCVIDGCFNLSSLNSSGNSLAKLNELIEKYREKFASGDDDKFEILHSKDGSEVCSSLVDLINSIDSNSDAVISSGSVQRHTANPSLTNFVCFVKQNY